jgi:hypothetical protein
MIWHPMYAINIRNRYRYAPNVLPNNPKYFHALNKPNYYFKTGINENKANRATNDHITLSPLNCLLAVSFVFNI